jgi:hypothetical protein
VAVAASVAAAARPMGPISAKGLAELFFLLSSLLKFGNWQALYKNHFFWVVVVDINGITFARSDIDVNHIISGSLVANANYTDFHHGLAFGVFQDDQGAMIETDFDFLVSRQMKFMLEDYGLGDLWEKNLLGDPP